MWNASVEWLDRNEWNIEFSADMGHGEGEKEEGEQTRLISVGGYG